MTNVIDQDVIHRASSNLPVKTATNYLQIKRTPGMMCWRRNPEGTYAFSGGGPGGGVYRTQNAQEVARIASGSYGDPKQIRVALETLGWKDVAYWYGLHTIDTGINI